MYSFHNLQCRLTERFLGLLGADCDCSRKSGHKVTSAYIHRLILCKWIAGSNLNLNILCGTLTDQKIVFLTHITDQSLVEIVSGDLDRCTYNRSTQRDDSDIRSTSSDIYDHISAWSCNINSGSDCSCDRLLNNFYLAGTSLIRCVLNGLLLYFSNTARYADADAWLTEALLAKSFLDKVLDHLLGNGVI